MTNDRGRIEVRSFAASLVAIFVVAGGPAMAADFSIADETLVETEAVPPGGWNFRVTPYAWFAGISGSVTAAGRTASTSASLFELIQNSDEFVPAMGYFEASKDRFSIFGDVFYSRVGFSGEQTIQKNPVPGLTITANAKAALTTTLTIAQVAAAYDVIEQSGSSVGFYAGGRYWYTDAELKLKITAQVNLHKLGLVRSGKFALAVDHGTDWVDPIVGMRVRQELTPHDELTFLGDVGGFGVGSQFSWQVFGGYTHTWNISPTKDLALTLGYRALSVDYEQGSGIDKRGLNLLLHGPVAGLGFHW